MAAYDENPILELGRTPIPGPSPTGADVSDEESYISLQAELAKMDRIEAGGEPDWYTMEELCKVLLSSKAKDAEVAYALGLALFKRQGYAGLAAVLGLLVELVNNFWDGMFPERPRRRKARMESLCDRFTDGGWFRDNPPKPDQFDAIDACVTRIAELKAKLTEKMGDDPPDFSKFERGIKELAGRRPKAAEPAPAPAAGGAPAGGAAPAGGGGAGFAPVEVKDPGAALKAVLEAATFLRKADPTDPIAYALVRILKWAKIQLPATPEARTQIPPPENSTVEALVHQYNNQLWEHLLKSAESAFRSNDPLWLDLQKYVCNAMTGLGPAYDKAKQAVMSATGALVNRLGSGIYELQYRGGTPLCSGETKMWIEAEVLPAQGGGKGGGRSSGAGNGKLDEATDKARKLAGSGQLKEALTGLQEGMGQCTQRRDRLLWKLSIAKLCYDAKRLQLASPLLEACREEIQRYHVDEWEPSLAVEVADTLYRCRKSMIAGEKEPSKEAMESVKETYAWLCQLDPLAALDADPAGK